MGWGKVMQISYKLTCSPPPTGLGARGTFLSDLSAMDLTKKAMVKMCRDNGLYASPALNDKLYLHYKGIRQIRNLEEYTGLRVLWLEGNGICKLEGMETLTEMRTLYVHENLIEKIEGLEQLREAIQSIQKRVDVAMSALEMLQLDTLNLSKNFIHCVENISHLGRLTTLLLAHNHLETADSVRHVLRCPSIQTLDLQYNRINDLEVVNVVSAMHDLRVLYLQGNPVVKHVRHYRKTIVSSCTALKYLDDRPVFYEERRRSNAWSRGMTSGGISHAQEAERKEMTNIREEKREMEERQYKAFEKMMREGLEVKRLKEQQAPGADNVSVQQMETAAQTFLLSHQIEEASRDSDCVSDCAAADTHGNLSRYDVQRHIESGGHDDFPCPWSVAPPPPPDVSQETPSLTEKVIASCDKAVASMLTTPCTNAFSGERVVSFNDCKNVRGARQSRVAQILDGSSIPSVPEADPGAETRSSTEQTAYTPMQAPHLDEDGLHPDQPAKHVNGDIYTLEEDIHCLGQRRIEQNIPPPPPSTVVIAQDRRSHDYNAGGNEPAEIPLDRNLKISTKGNETAMYQPLALGPESGNAVGEKRIIYRQMETNFEELD